MANPLFSSPVWPQLAINGQEATYPVHRVFCVGRNYAAHAAEMGVEVDREAPFYFLKSALHVVVSGATIAYPPGTNNFHYEMELVLAIGQAVFQADLASAKAAIFGYGTGLDMTRRDLQMAARAKERPWDFGKDFECGCVLSSLTPAQDMAEIGPQRIQLSVNGVLKQDATLDEMVWSPVELVAHLSQYYHLQPGDIILTGTPAGVGPVLPGDHITGGVDGLCDIALTIGPAT